MKVNQVTRILSPATRMVRDSLVRVASLDAYEIKDQANVVIGWRLPKDVITHEQLIKKFAELGIRRVARSESIDKESKLSMVKYTHRIDDVMIETTIFPEFLTINLQ